MLRGLADGIEMGLGIGRSRLCILPCWNRRKGRYKLMRIFVLVIKFRHDKASDGEHGNLTVEKLIPVIHIHRLDIRKGNLALIRIFHIVAELQPFLKHWMIKVYRG